MWAYEVTLAPNVVNNGGKKHPQEQNSHLRQVTIWGGDCGTPTRIFLTTVIMTGKMVQSFSLETLRHEYQRKRGFITFGNPLATQQTKKSLKMLDLQGF